MDLIEKGWECPKCGAVMSPTTECCVNCKGISEYTITCDFDSNFKEILSRALEQDRKLNEKAK